MITVIPAPLETTESGYAQTIEKINHCPELIEGWIQIDFADGEFVSTQTVGLDIVQKYPTELNKEAHLMVKDPVNWLQSLNKLGFQRVLIHLESENCSEAINQARKIGLGVGIVLNPQTAVEAAKPYWSMVEVIQLMSVQPGLQGQEFITETNQKIEQLARLRTENKVHFLIAVDGGLNAKSIPGVVQAGADNLVIGSALVKGDIDENLETIWEVLQR